MKPLDAATACSGLPTSTRCDASLPDSPQCAPNYHFGMLLGVEDFRAEQGFHVGRLRRHQRLLHGAGIVAGFPVEFDAPRYELKVGAGYGIDVLGRDLSLDSSRCVNLALWWARHAKDADFDDVKPGETKFDLDLVVCYANCLDRPVPAIAEPCAGDAADIAHSRICETVSLSLVRHKEAAPAPTHTDYHLLRMWLGMEPAAFNAKGELLPDDKWLRDEYARLHSLPAAQQESARQTLLTELLARAVAATSPFTPETESEDACLTLARLRDVQVKQNTDRNWIIEIGAIELGARSSLLPSSVLQALALATPPATPAAAGPVIVRDGATINGSTINLVFSQKLSRHSAKSPAFSVSEFMPAEGWKLFTLEEPEYDEATPAGPVVRLTLDRPPTGERLRITVIGTGSTPLLSDTFIPAGALHPDSDGRTLTTTLSI